MLYALTHSHYIKKYNLYNTKDIGIFSSEELVKRIIAYKSRNERWFKEYPDWFEIKRFYINDDKKFIYRLWETKLYTLTYCIDKKEYCETLGIFSSKELAKEKRDKLIEKKWYQKKTLYINWELLDHEAWKEGFISAKEAMEWIPKE